MFFDEADKLKTLTNAMKEVQQGVHVATIAFSDSAIAFENRVQFMIAWSQQDPYLPTVTLIVLDACDPKASKPRLLWRSGYEYYYKDFYRQSGELQTLNRYLPGKTWDDIAGASYANFSLPDLQLTSLEPFNALWREIEQACTPSALSSP